MDGANLFPLLCGGALHAPQLCCAGAPPQFDSSSSSVYGDSALPMNEDGIPKPVSPYGVSKLAGENLCYLYWKNYDVPTVSLRYFTVYGPRQRPDMAIYKFIKSSIQNDEIIVFGNGKQTRDFTYVSDVIDAIILASEKDVNGQIFNIGGGNRISVNDLIYVIAGVLRKNIRLKNIENEKGDVRDTLAELSKARETLNWSPKVDIHCGIKNYINWLSENHVYNL